MNFENNEEPSTILTDNGPIKNKSIHDISISVDNSETKENCRKSKIVRPSIKDPNSSNTNGEIC